MCQDVSIVLFNSFPPYKHFERADLFSEWNCIFFCTIFCLYKCLTKLPLMKLLYKRRQQFCIDHWKLGGSVIWLLQDCLLFGVWNTMPHNGMQWINVLKGEEKESKSRICKNMQKRAAWDAGFWIIDIIMYVVRCVAHQIQRHGKSLASRQPLSICFALWQSHLRYEGVDVCWFSCKITRSFCRQSFWVDWNSSRSEAFLQAYKWKGSRCLVAEVLHWRPLLGQRNPMGEGNVSFRFLFFWSQTIWQTCGDMLLKARLLTASDLKTFVDFVVYGVAATIVIARFMFSRQSNFSL